MPLPQDTKVLVPEPAPFSMDGFWDGFRQCLLIAPGITVFSAGFGAAAAVEGLSFLDTFFFSVIVYAGASQYVALGLWSEPITWTTAFAMAAVAFTVNLRMMLMGAALRPWLGGLPSYQVYPALIIITDPAWIIATRYHRDGGQDWGIYLGACVCLYLNWVVSVVPGYIFAAALDDPSRYALDLIMPIFFVTMLVPIWRGRTDLVPWIVAVVVSLASQRFIPGYWFVLAGGLAAAFTAALLFKDEKAETQEPG
ncbi:MAG: AzlC family ABC transporter permease [Pseudomonadota bacterium]